jgi:hypothetical protein
VWLPAAETLPAKAAVSAPTGPEGPETPGLPEQVSRDVRAAECGCLDEGPEVPTGERLAGRPRQPES